MILRYVKWPKGTPTGDALREWLASFEQKPKAPAPELDMAVVKAEGFGPEAHDDDPAAEPKMVIQSGGQSLPAVQALPHQASQA